MQLQKNVPNYLQCMSTAEENHGYLVAETVRAGQEQTIALPPPVDLNAPNEADLEIMRIEKVKTVAKRRSRLAKSLKKGYVTMYDQCCDAVKEKLEATEDLDKTQ